MRKLTFLIPLAAATSVTAAVASCSTKDNTQTDAGKDTSDDPYAQYTASWDRPINRVDDWEAKHNRDVCGFKAGAMPAETLGKMIPVDKDMPIHISNIALFNPATKKADRAGVKSLEDGRKVRVFKANGEQVDA